MKRFKFELETLLTIRERAEKSVKEELAQKNAEIINAQNLFSDIEQNLRNLQNEEKEKRSDTADVISMRFSVSFRNKLKADLLQEGQTIQALQREAWIIQQRLIRSTQEKKALELLKEKRFLEWKKRNNIKEQSFIDDISGQGYIRKQKGT